MKLLVLDGNSILNRAFYGIKLLTTKDGHYTNAIYGFLTMLQKLREETLPEAVAIAFDRKAPTFRHLAYAGYKAQRKGMPAELAEQLPVLKELLHLLGYRTVECDSFEADDILGTLAASCERNGDECVIATGDRDSLQLVRPGVTVRLTATKMGRPEVTVYDEAKVKEDYGVSPRQLIDVKAIQGDSSDNIPGVAGIGQKGAADLIGRFGDLDAIYSALDVLEIREGVRQKLAAGKESAYLSRMLGTIRTDAPVPTAAADYKMEPGNPQEAARLMAKLEFFSLIDKFGLHKQAEAVQKTRQTQEGYAFLRVEEERAEVFAQTLYKKKKMDFLPVFEGETLVSLLVASEEKVLFWEIEGASFAPLRAVLEDKTVSKRTHDIKPVYAALQKAGVLLEGAQLDTMLAGYLLNPSASGYGLARMAEEYAIAGRQVSGAPENLAQKAAECALFPALADKLGLLIAEKGQERLLGEIEMPLARVLARMETVGFAVDEAGIRQYGEVIEKKLLKIEQAVYDAVGYSFNINSPKQLGEALFVKLALPKGKKTKSGYSTSAEVLEELRYAHPAVELVLEFRTLSKLKSTYCDGLLKVIGPDGRIHSSFNQAETRTGRISSTEPNLQNIPVRTELGRELRRFFCAKEGFVLVDADYSQIELRVLAHMAGDRNMIEAFRQGTDIHTVTASEVFGMPQEMVTPLMRSRAKAVNFGIVYGIGAFSLSKDIGVTRAEADRYIKGYLSHYSGVDSYMKRMVESAKETGYAETLFGRRRYLPELTASNFNLRSFGERVARNMPIQGTAADIIKIAMVRVEERLAREGLNARLILQVHDELMVEAAREEANRVAELLREEMEGAVQLSVPLTAEAKTGKTWFDAKD